MSYTDFGGTQPTPQGAGTTDVVTQLQGIVRQLTNLNKSINGRNVFGTFTMPNASSFTVNQPGVKANSVITFSPTNAAAGTIMGSAVSLYYTINPGVSFTVFTASGAASGSSTGTFSYVVHSPT